MLTTVSKQVNVMLHCSSPAGERRAISPAAWLCLSFVLAHRERRAPSGGLMPLMGFILD